jgi:hypothetical protein
VPDLLGTAQPPGAQLWRWDWQMAARCRGRTDLFFHPHGEREPVRASARPRPSRSAPAARSDASAWTTR